MENKALVVKDWFHSKKMDEMGFRGVNSSNVFAIIKETEKAYNVMVVGSFKKGATYWVPKSCVEVLEAGEQPDGSIKKAPLVGLEWADANSRWNDMWSCYC